MPMDIYTLLYTLCALSSGTCGTFGNRVNIEITVFAKQSSEFLDTQKIQILHNIQKHKMNATCVTSFQSRILGFAFVCPHPAGMAG